MKKFQLDVITPTRKAFSESVESVVVPTTIGIIDVLAGHMPLFTALKDGEVKIKVGDKEYFLAIGGGFMEVQKTGNVTILVSRAAHASEINEAEIKKALESAKSLIARKVTGDELTHALTILRRSTVDLKVAKRKKSTPLYSTSSS